jgi:hypothetical protein
MKVLKEGIPPNPNFRGTCRICNTEIEAEPSDIKRHDPDQRDPRESTYYTTTCPVCHRGMNVVPVDPKSIRY